MPGSEENDGPVYRMPSLPLPTSTPYRLTLPLVSRRNRHGIINRLDVLHAHSPFVTGWMSVRYARRLRMPLVYTYHTRLGRIRTLRSVRSESHASRGIHPDAQLANLADAVIVPTPAMRERLMETRRNGARGSDPERYRFARVSVPERRNAALRAKLGVR